MIEGPEKNTRVCRSAPVLLYKPPNTHKVPKVDHILANGDGVCPPSLPRFENLSPIWLIPEQAEPFDSLNITDFAVLIDGAHHLGGWEFTAVSPMQELGRVMAKVRRILTELSHGARFRTFPRQRLRRGHRGQVRRSQRRGAPRISERNRPCLERPP